MKHSVYHSSAIFFLKNFIFILLCNQYIILAQTDTLKYPQGLREPTSEEIEWQKKNLINTIRVLPNKIALGRFQNCNKNKEISEYKNFSEMNLPQTGEEILGFKGEDLLTPMALDRKMPSEEYLLPYKVDNTEFPFFPGIGNQGSLGSCEEFSSIYYTFTHMTGLLRNWSTLKKVFSPAWLYNHNKFIIHPKENSGEMGILMYHGCATMDEFYYDGINWKNWCTDANVWQNALSMRLKSCGLISNVSPDNTTAFNNLKQMLANGYLLNVHTLIDNWVYTRTKDDTTTHEDDIFVDEAACRAVCGPSDIGGHAMTVVGYNDSIWIDINKNNVVDDGEEGAFRIANSWGSIWGNKGFIWFAYDALRKNSIIPDAPNADRLDGWRDGNNAYWLLPRKNDYKPFLLAEITLYHSRRNQIMLWLGVSDTSVSTPEYIWHPCILQNAGQEYAFDGTNMACDGSFAFDFNDLVIENNIDTKKVLRWYIAVEDNINIDPTTIKSFKLVDVNNNNNELSAGNLPVSFDNGIQYVYIDYEPIGDPNLEYTVSSAWWSDSTDTDDDGYFSHRKLSFDVDASAGSHSVYARISCCRRPILAGPCWYYTTPDFTVTGAGLSDSLTVDIGLPNNELTHGTYQVCFRIFDASTDEALTGYYYMADSMGFETTAEDAVEYIISSTWWNDSTDKDDDGYYRHIKLGFDVDASAGSNSVYAKLSLCKEPVMAGPCWYYTTADFTVTGAGLSDSLSIDIGMPNRELSHGTYQVILRIYDASNDEALTSYDYISDDMRFEKIAEDAVEFTITSAWWSDTTDIDHDGYYRTRRFNFDVDASAGSHLVYAKVSCCKYPVLSGPCWFYTSSDFPVTGTSLSDSFSIDIGLPGNELIHGTYQVCLQICDTSTEEVLASYIAEEMGFETGADDTYLSMISDNDLKYIMIYPNPAIDELVLEMEGKRKQIDFEIFNLLGEKVFNGILVDKIIIKTADFSSGVYIIRLKNDRSFIVRKIIKE
jgi:hypothetical protein